MRPPVPAGPCKTRSAQNSRRIAPVSITSRRIMPLIPTCPRLPRDLSESRAEAAAVADTPTYLCDRFTGVPRHLGSNGCYQRGQERWSPRTSDKDKKMVRLPSDDGE